MKICMFVLNNCLHDARVLKEAKTLADAGFDVRIIAKLDKDTQHFEQKDGFRIIRVYPLDIYIRIFRGLVTAQSRSSQVGLLSELASQSTTARVREFLKSMLVRPFAPVLRPLHFLGFSYQQWRAINNEPADVYHSHDLNTLLIGWFSKRRTVGKLVYDAHELSTELAYLGRVESLLSKLLERCLIHRADAVIVPGEFRAKYLCEKYGISPPVEIMNCPPLSRENPCSYSLRERLGIADTVPVIVYTGGLQRGRGLENLILSAAHLDRGIIVLMGWGGLEHELREMVRKEGLEEKVLFAEPVPPEDLVDHIASASIGVVIYQYTCLNNFYASSNKLFEYIHAGLPVVSSDFPALKNIVKGYQLGETFDPEDPEDIAAAINYILSDKRRCNKMRRNALEAAKIFNWENESKKLLALYESLGISTYD